MKHFIYILGAIIILPIQLIGGIIETILYAFIDILVFWEKFNYFDNYPKSLDFLQKWRNFIYKNKSNESTKNQDIRAENGETN